MTAKQTSTKNDLRHALRTCAHIELLAGSLHLLTDLNISKRAYGRGQRVGQTARKARSLASPEEKENVDERVHVQTLL